MAHVWRLALAAFVAHAGSKSVEVPAVPDRLSSSLLSLAASTTCSWAVPGAEQKHIECAAAHFLNQEPELTSITSSVHVLNPIYGCGGGEERGSEGVVCAVRRGECSFDDKVKFAQHSGCGALVIVDREGVDLAPPGVSIPADPSSGRAFSMPVVMVGLEEGNPLLAEQSPSMTIHVEGVSSAEELLATAPQDLTRLQGRQPCTVPGNNSFLDLECQAHHRTHPRATPVRVFEGLMFNNELEMLALHLEELHHVVDKFIVVEARHTHQGHEKPLYLTEALRKEQKDSSGYTGVRFARFLPVLEIFVINEFPDGGDCTKRCACENHQRNAISDGLRAMDLKVRDQDIIIVSDVDEILRPEVIYRLKHCQVPLPTYFHLNFFYYSFHYQNTWTSDRSGAFDGAMWRNGTLPHDVRLLDYPFRSAVSDAGWHCSYFGGVDQIVNKLHSNCQTEYAGPPWDNAARIRRVIENGEDLFERKTEALTHIKGCMHAPRAVAEVDDHPYCRYSY